MWEMCALEIADAHQKLAHDLAPGETKRSFEELYPFLSGSGVMCREPAGE
jgi:hypothetical protein